MLNIIQKSWLAILLLLGATQMAWAESPEQVVNRITDQVMAEIPAARGYYKSNPQRFYGKLEGIILPYVDLDYIARSVMGRYARQASPQQISRFKQTFKNSLLNLYGKSLLDYQKQKIEVVGSRSLKGNNAPTMVDQRFTTTKGQVIPISYTMHQVGGRWKLRNVTINGINVGKLYRDHFGRSMNEHRRDIDAVIGDWSKVVKQAEAEADLKKTVK